MKPNIRLKLAVLVLVAVATAGCAAQAAPTPAPAEEVPVEATPALEAEALVMPSATAAPLSADGPYPSTGGLVPPNDEPYADVFFDDPGVNPFIDTEDDHFSTFAVDVDTASYTVMRRYVDDG